MCMRLHICLCVSCIWQRKCAHTGNCCHLIHYKVIQLSPVHGCEDHFEYVNHYMYMAVCVRVLSCARDDQRRSLCRLNIMRTPLLFQSSLLSYHPPASATELLKSPSFLPICAACLPQPTSSSPLEMALPCSMKSQSYQFSRQSHRQRSAS